MEIMKVKKSHKDDKRYERMYPLGIAYRFVTQCRVTGNKRESLGLFLNEESATQAAQVFMSKNRTHI